MIKVSTAVTWQIEDHPTREPKSLILRQSCVINRCGEYSRCSFAKAAVQKRTVASGKLCSIFRLETLDPPLIDSVRRPKPDEVGGGIPDE
jgi:hypothetical protein